MVNNFCNEDDFYGYEDGDYDEDYEFEQGEAVKKELVPADCTCGSGLLNHQCCFDDEEEWARQFEAPDDPRY